jgi:hypothetical protein
MLRWIKAPLARPPLAVAGDGAAVLGCCSAVVQISWEMLLPIRPAMLN